MASYLDGAAIRESSMTTKISDISSSAQSSLVNSFYVHSKVRNFYNNKQYVNAKDLAKSIDKKLSSEFNKAIKECVAREQAIYHSLHVNNSQELQELFNLDNFQVQFNDNFSFYKILERIVNDYKGTTSNKTISSQELSNSLTEASNDIRNLYTDLLLSYRDKILGTKKKSGSSILIDKMDSELDKILLSVQKNKEIDLDDLLQSPSKYIGGLSRWQGLTGEINQYVATLENQYIDFVEGELTGQLSGKKNKTDIRLNTNSKLTVNLSVKNYKPPKDTQSRISFGIHASSKLSDFVKMLAKAGNVSKKSTINYFIYNLVNMLAFSRSGAVDDGETVSTYSNTDFEAYSEYTHIIKKTAAYWLGYKSLYTDDTLKGVNFMVVNGTIVPISEILKELKQEIINSPFRVSSSFSNVPKFSPNSLWDEKKALLGSLPSMYSTGTRNYPSQLIQIGSSVGQAIANQTSVNINLSIAIDRLIRR